MTNDDNLVHELEYSKQSFWDARSSQTQTFGARLNRERKTLILLFALLAGKEYITHYFP